MTNKESKKNITQDILALIPAYNPDKGMITLVEELTEHFSHIVIVDDGCGEEYAPIFEKVAAFPQVEVLKHEENKGKGRAIKTGFSYIVEHYPDALGVVMRRINETTGAGTLSRGFSILSRNSVTSISAGEMPLRSSASMTPSA